LSEALKIAKNQGATLRIIHVINELMVIASYEGVIYSGELMQALHDAGKALLADAKNKVSAVNVPAETALVEAHGGQAGSTIVKEANEWHADLIVLGTHGRRGLSRVVMGSDAEQVVRLATVPVLLVKAATT
jgi:nucleotide-binding universal stress UspA family protein